MSGYVGEVKFLVADEFDLGDGDETKVLLANERRVLDRLLADVVHVLEQSRNKSTRVLDPIGSDQR